MTELKAQTETMGRIGVVLTAALETTALPVFKAAQNSRAAGSCHGPVGGSRGAGWKKAWNTAIPTAELQMGSARFLSRDSSLEGKSDTASRVR